MCSAGRDGGCSGCVYMCQFMSVCVISCGHRFKEILLTALVRPLFAGLSSALPRLCLCARLHP